MLMFCERISHLSSPSGYCVADARQVSQKLQPCNFRGHKKTPDKIGGL